MRQLLLSCVLSGLACAAVTVTSADARAQGGRSDKTSTDKSDKDKGQSAEKKGDELAQRAYDAYDKGDFAQAIALYLDAYKANPASEVLFNVATIYDKKLKNADLAIEYYRKYLSASDTDPELVRKATDRINALRAAKEESPPKPQEGGKEPEKAPPARAEPESDPGKGLRLAGLIGGATGLVVLGVGTAFGLDAMGKNDDAKSKCTGKVCSDPRAITLTASASDNAGISTAMFAAGGVLLAGGITLYLLAPKSEPRSSAASGTTLRLAPLLGAGVSGIHISGEFL